MQGIIVGNIANLYNVKAQNGVVYKSTARGKFKQDNISPVVGDKVDIEIVDEEKNEAVIEKIYDRTSYIKRPKVANVSQIVLIVSTRNPKPDLLMLDKQLAYAELIGIKPIILVNKIDLDNSYIEIEKEYSKIGYEVICISAKDILENKDNNEIKEFKKLLKDKITVFSGNSGVGKSTTINALFGGEVTQEGEISQKNKRGKNTTTDVKLFELYENTFIADTPGFSTFEITEIESKDLDKYFKEFKDKISNCEYVGCSHVKETNCGVKKAVEEGIIPKERYDRYCTIYKEIKEKEERRW